MDCPKCKAELVQGIAINPVRDYNNRYVIANNRFSTYKTLKIINVLKCPLCGYSDNGK